MIFTRLPLMTTGLRLVQFQVLVRQLRPRGVDQAARAKGDSRGDSALDEFPAGRHSYFSSSRRYKFQS
jgi:hypothetical protein